VRKKRKKKRKKERERERDGRKKSKRNDRGLPEVSGASPILMIL